MAPGDTDSDAAIRDSDARLRDPIPPLADAQGAGDAGTAPLAGPGTAHTHTHTIFSYNIIINIHFGI